MEDGKLKTNRTSLSKLVTRNATFRIEGNEIILLNTDDTDGSVIGEKDRYTIIEFRHKKAEGWNGDTCDVYAIRTKDLPGYMRGMAPFVGGIDDREISPSLSL